MSISSEQILMRVTMEEQTAVMECLCAAVQALGTNSLPPELNPYYSPPATATGNPSPAPEQFPAEWSLCGAAYGYIEYLARYCDKLAELAGSPIWSGLALLAAVVAGAGVVLSGGSVALAIGGASVATGLWSWVSAAAEGSLVATFQAAAEDLRTNEPLMRCSTGAFVDSGTVAAFGAMVDANASSPLVASLINILATQETMDAHRDGIVDNGQLYFPEGDSSLGCGCIELPVITSYDFDDGTTQGWYIVPMVAGSVSNSGSVNHIQRSGSYALRVTHAAQATTAWEWRLDVGGVVKLGDTFTKHVRELSGNTTVYVEAKFTDGTFARSAVYGDWAANTWQEVSLVIGAGDAGKEYQYIALYGSSGAAYDNLGYFFVDDVQTELW